MIYFFTEINKADLFAILAVPAVGVPAIITNFKAFRLLLRQERLTRTARLYLSADQLVRLVMSILFMYNFPAAFIRFDKDEHWADPGNDGYYSGQDMPAHFDYTVYSMVWEKFERNLSAMGQAPCLLCRRINAISATYFFFILHAKEVLQLGLSFNRILGVIKNGRYYTYTMKRPYTQIFLLLSLAYLPLFFFYSGRKYSPLTYHPFQHSLFSTSSGRFDLGLDWILRAIAFGMSLVSASIDVVTFFKVRRQLQNSQGMIHTKSQNVHRPDFRLAKQIVVNQAMNTLLVVPTLYYYCLEFLGTRWQPTVSLRFAIMNTLYYPIGTMYAPVLANFISGCVAIQYFKPKKNVPGRGWLSSIFASQRRRRRNTNVTAVPVSSVMKESGI
ncbi:unnamed protein product, partial [Mesorhabditis spiculigera]